MTTEYKRYICKKKNNNTEINSRNYQTKNVISFCINCWRENPRRLFPVHETRRRYDYSVFVRWLYLLSSRMTGSRAAFAGSRPWIVDPAKIVASTTTWLRPNDGSSTDFPFSFLRYYFHIEKPQDWGICVICILAQLFFSFYILSLHWNKRTNFVSYTSIRFFSFFFLFFIKLSLASFSKKRRRKKKRLVVNVFEEDCS